MRDAYIDLDRRFLDYQQGAASEEAVLNSDASPSDGKLTWDDLIAHGRVVLLGEADSGKTWEMEAQAERLVRAGQDAFFVRIDALVRGSVEEALDSADRSKFSKWKKGEGHGIFLLDAKDEAQLMDHHAFERALKTFSNEISSPPTEMRRYAASNAYFYRQTLRARRLHSIILSCRVSEWQPLSDREMVLRLLGPSPFLNSDDEKDPPLRVVQIAPLDNDRIRRFALRRVTEPDAFLNAVDQAHAWEFARRPPRCREFDRVLGRAEAAGLAERTAGIRRHPQAHRH